MLPRRYHRIRQVLDQRQPDLTVLMENVSKPHNISAILRTCDAVGVFEAHAVNPRGNVPTFNSTAQGSQKWVKLKIHDSTEAAIDHLKDQGFAVYSTHLSGSARDFREVDYTQPTAILMGAEKWGVSAAASERCEHIIVPMVGMVESLNVSVANATILFEAQRQRQRAGMYMQPRLEPGLYQRTLFEWGYPELAKRYRLQDEPYPELGLEGELLMPVMMDPVPVA
jgi:tRNA (guanosine-2'-O-)-methyltransferase